LSSPFRMGCDEALHECDNPALAEPFSSRFLAMRAESGHVDRILLCRRGRSE
jgi:hypothetical protein